MQERLNALPATLAGIHGRGSGSTSTSRRAQIALSADLPDPDAMMRENADLNRAIDQLEADLDTLVPITGPRRGDIHPDPEAIRILQEAISRGDRQAAQPRTRSLRRAVEPADAITEVEPARRP